MYQTHIPNKKVPKTHTAKFTNFKGWTDNSMIIVGDYSAPLSIKERTIRQKIDPLLCVWSEEQDKLFTEIDTGLWVFQEANQMVHDPELKANLGSSVSWECPWASGWWNVCNSPGANHRDGGKSQQLKVGQDLAEVPLGPHPSYNMSDLIQSQ